jgi:hypothetical protein
VKRRVEKKGRFYFCFGPEARDRDSGARVVATDYLSFIIFYFILFYFIFINFSEK